MSNSHPIIPVITIDGPTGSGKGTVSRLVAEQLGWHLLDSGVIYRVLGVAALEHHIAVDDEPALAKLAGHLQVEFLPDTANGCKVLLAGQDVTATIRQEKIGSQASKVSQYHTVRAALMEKQRSFRRFPGLVTDGRDMGTVVFPDATLKIFLSASPEERAKRRYRQLIAQHQPADYNEILNDLLVRDHRDRTRPVAPLKPAADAKLIDSTDLSIEQVVQQIVDFAKQLHV